MEAAEGPSDGAEQPPPGDPFHAGVQHLLSVHSQVQEEVFHLRDLVSHYESTFKRFQVAAVCAAADEPEMQALMGEVSREVAMIAAEEGYESCENDEPELRTPSTAVSHKGEQQRSPRAPLRSPAAAGAKQRPPLAPTCATPATARLTPQQSPRRHSPEQSEAGSSVNPLLLALEEKGAPDPPSNGQSTSLPQAVDIDSRQSSHASRISAKERVPLAPGAAERALATVESFPRPSGSVASSDGKSAASGDKCAASGEEHPVGMGLASSVCNSPRAPTERRVRISSRVPHPWCVEKETPYADRLLRVSSGYSPSAAGARQSDQSITHRVRVSILPGGSVNEETLPIARRLSKEAEAVLTTAGKRALKKMQVRRRRFKKAEVKLSEQTYLRRVVEHTAFDLLCATVIILNSLLIGFEIDWRTSHDTEAPNTQIMNYVCTVFFLAELLMRMSVEGLVTFFVNSEQRNWNGFDFVLVLMSLVDVLLTDIVSVGGDAAGVSSGLKTIKMLRIVRVCRVFRFFQELSQLALMIIDSVKSLLWALIMLFIVIYVFGILFTHTATDHVRAVATDSSIEQDMITSHFGSLGTTLYTLFHAMLNGISWYVLTDALWNLHPFVFVLFLFYIAFTMLAVLNIITGVFVDNAVETARTQREFLVQKEMELKEKWCEEMRGLFQEMDSDGSGTVSLKEVKEFFNDERVQSYFQALGLETHDAERLFILLDEDNSGDLNMDEFLDGCLRLKGHARSIDVYALMHDYRKLNQRFHQLEEAMYLSLHPQLESSGHHQKMQASGCVRPSDWSDSN